MKELHTGQNNDAISFEYSEGQRGPLCSNKASLSRCPSLGSSPKLSKDNLNALEELGDVLKSIRRRMYREGYEILDGAVVRKNDVNVYE
ncbi:hypothetical protein GW937_00060 [Candidatus Kaiserbacteria bacterium]|nr:hypothetical protein [Candidatus Kaiserbacteria bacterium]